jgi:hypothetical protein
MQFPKLKAISNVAEGAKQSVMIAALALAVALVAILLAIGGRNGN